MRSIKSLPEAVRSSVRSGVILFDITRVVEELVFNSLDSGASKVNPFQLLLLHPLDQILNVAHLNAK